MHAASESRDVPGAPPAITVVTLTRRRPELLSRAIKSVRAQAVSASIHHLVLIDDCPLTLQHLDQLDLDNQPRYTISYRLCRRGPTDQSGMARSARLRNLAVTLSSTEWIAILDDDNEFSADHLAMLLDTASATGARAVHSWRRVYCPDGSPFCEPRDPWTSGQRAFDRFAWLAAKAVRTADSNVFRDRCDPVGVSDPVRTVDSSEWLLHRSLFDTVAFDEVYSPEDWENMIGEDDKLQRDLVAHQIAVACSERPTLKYYLGGYSNTRRLL